MTARRNVPTGIDAKLFDSLGRVLTTIPDDLTVHKTLGRVIDAKREMFKTGTGFDWATGEALAYGSLATEGFNIRLSGQDFGARHVQPAPRRLGRSERRAPLCAAGDAAAWPVRSA